MTKLAVLFFTALAFQASVAVPRYYEEGTLFKYLDEIKTEVRDLTVYFESDFPEHLLAVKTVTWECNKLIEVVENIIRKLREETFLLHTDDKVFKDVVFALDEVVEVLKRVTLYRDVTDVNELRKCFVLSIHTITERLEKLITLTYTYYPEFRFTLKYLLVDIMTTLHGIRSNFMHVNKGFEVVHEPRYLLKEIHEYTREFTSILKDFTHRTQVKVALRGYLMYVREIVRVLEERSMLGHKELDVLLVHFTDKLRKIVFSLMEIMNHEVVDIKIIKTEIITNVFEVVHILEQLVQLCEDKILPEDLTLFLVRIIYHYYYAVRHVCYEIKFGYKIGFYMNKYYDTDFYGKYGFGLYERDMYFNKWDKYMFTPYMHRTLFPVDKHFKHLYGKTFDFNKFGLNYDRYNMEGFRGIRDMTYMNDWKYDSRLPYGNNFNWDRFGMNYWNKYNMREMGNMRDMRYMKDNMYNNEHFFGMGMNGMRYGLNSRMDLVRNLEVLLKRVRDTLKYDTVDVKDMHHIIIYRIREFIEILDWILLKCETKVVYDNSVFVELIHKIKKIRMELSGMARTGVFTDIHEIRMMYIRCVEEFGGILLRWIDMYQVKDGFVQDICYKFITFLHKICEGRMHMTRDWTFRNWSMGRTMPMVYNNRMMNYYKY